MKKKYVYYVRCVIGRNTWIEDFLITCNDVDEILPMFLDAGYDSTDAYGEPKKQVIKIHHIQRFAICRGEGPPSGIIEMYRMFVDVKPNEFF